MPDTDLKGLVILHLRQNTQVTRLSDIVFNYLLDIFEVDNNVLQQHTDHNTHCE